MGAVFNRDYPGNRGRPATSSVESRPLPPTINFFLNDLEFYVVSYERRRWLEKRPVKSKKETNEHRILQRRTVSIERPTSNIE